MSKWFDACSSRENLAVQRLADECAGNRDLLKPFKNASVFAAGALSTRSANVITACVQLDAEAGKQSKNTLLDIFERYIDG